MHHFFATCGQVFGDVFIAFVDLSAEIILFFSVPFSAISETGFSVAFLPQYTHDLEVAGSSPLCTCYLTSFHPSRSNDHLAIPTHLHHIISSSPSRHVQARKPYTITKARERWTDNEPARFLEGLSLFGRSWGKVAQHVQTKTTIQIRSHAQKYFNRVKKQQGMHLVSTTQASFHAINPKHRCKNGRQSTSQHTL